MQTGPRWIGIQILSVLAEKPKTKKELTEVLDTDYDTIRRNMDRLHNLRLIEGRGYRGRVPVWGISSQLRNAQ